MDIELGEVQAKFADIIWEREPIASGELTKICEKELGWKKSTTYTVLKKLCEKGICVFESTVRQSITRTGLTSGRNKIFLHAPAARACG